MPLTKSTNEVVNRGGQHLPLGSVETLISQNEPGHPGIIVDQAAISIPLPADFIEAQFTFSGKDGCF